jgi:hypothetical protein
MRRCIMRRKIACWIVLLATTFFTLGTTREAFARNHGGRGYDGFYRGGYYSNRGYYGGYYGRGYYGGYYGRSYYPYYRGYGYGYGYYPAYGYGSYNYPYSYGYAPYTTTYGWYTW